MVTTADSLDTVGSKQLCDILDITIRQLDWMCRETTLRAHVQRVNGCSESGKHRRWPKNLVRRLQVAKALADAAPRRRSQSLLPMAVEAVLAGPEPPEDGWVLLTPGGGVRYSKPGSGYLPSGIEPGVLALVPKP